MKDTVLPELPPVVEHTTAVLLSPAQRAAYSSAIREQIATGGAGGYLPLFNELRSICDIDPSTGASSKLGRAAELIGDIVREGSKCVVFSYKLDPLKALLTRLRAEWGNIAALLTGELNLAQRERAVQRFKADSSCSVLLASMRVASEGLTLTEANHVIFINRWWNPSTNSQAIDRVVRIGQRRSVTVYYLTCVDTIEDRLQPLLDRKRITFTQLIDALQYRPKAVSELLAP